MGRFSRSKGKRGERELAAELTRVLGITARRGQQFQGSPDSPDVVTDIQNVHFECKRTERFRLYESLEQAQNDAGPEKLPVVCHRQNGKPWVIVLKLDDLPAIITTLHRHLRPRTESDETTTDPAEHRPEDHPN